MDEGRKRVLGIMASILVARNLKTTEDLSIVQVRERSQWSPLLSSGQSA
jgi:hypothetical protein